MKLHDIDQAITAGGKHSTKMISGAISQSEARTRVFTVSEQNDSVLQAAEVNKYVKIERQEKSKMMAANSRISRVYANANYENDKQLQKIIRFLQTLGSTQIGRPPFPWRKSFIPSASIRIIYYTLMKD